MTVDNESEVAMMTAEQTIEEIVGSTKVTYLTFNDPSIDEKADAPKSLDISVAAKFLARRGRVKFLKGLAIGAVGASVLLPPASVLSGWVGQFVAAALLK